MEKQKRRKLINIGSVLLAAVLIMAGCGGGGSMKDNGAASSNNGSNNTKVFEININNTSPSTSSFAIGIYEPWKKLVEEKTGGRVQVNVYHGAALGSTNTVLKDVKGGVYDIGLIWTPYEVDSELFPLTIADLPFATTADVELNNKILNKYAEDYIADMSKEVIVLGLTASQSSYFIGKKPITSFEDLKDKKIRAVGKNEAETVKAWNAVPVSLPLEELYDSLQKGIIDIANTAASLAVDTYIYEVAPYLLNIPYKNVQMIPVINKKTYESIPADLKQLFDEELFPALVEYTLQTNINDSKTAVANFAKVVEGKGGLTEMPEEDVKKMKASVKPVWEEWVENANKKGYNGQEMLAKYQAALKEFGVELPF